MNGTVNCRNMLMLLWKTYEKLGKKELWAASYLMGEKIVHLITLLEQSIKQKQLKINIGKVEPKDW